MPKILKRLSCYEEKLFYRRRLSAVRFRALRCGRTAGEPLADRSGWKSGYRMDRPGGRCAPGPPRNERSAGLCRSALRRGRRRRIPVEPQCRLADAAHRTQQYTRLTDAAFRVGCSRDDRGRRRGVARGARAAYPVRRDADRRERLGERRRTAPFADPGALSFGRCPGLL